MMDKNSILSDSNKTNINNSTRYNDVNILIISGRSGSGKTSILNVLEDLGYHAIDNMPLSLVPKAVNKLIEEGNIRHLALGIDIRTLTADSSSFVNIQHALITSYGEDNVKTIYATAQESVLVARYASTRRVHPLMSIESSETYNLPKAIKQEAEVIEPISLSADLIIDTSELNIHQLKERIREYLGLFTQVKVNLLSFGFKYGIPIDSDFVFDVRVLPNPHWNSDLRSKTGLDVEVAQFFSNYSEVNDMKSDIQTFLTRWLPDFIDNNRHTLTIAIGCTGGKHRSVYISEYLQQALSENLPSEMVVSVKHREKPRWNL